MNNIISLSNYDIFDMPRPLREKPPQYWSKEEAEEYFDWLMISKPGRIRQIKQASGVSEGASVKKELNAISDTLRRSLVNLADDTLGVQRVSGLGFIVGFDAALVVADRIICADPNASWQIHYTAIKTLISRNLAVVRRPNSLFAFEPVLEGRLALKLIARGENAETGELYVWYENWLEKLKKER